MRILLGQELKIPGWHASEKWSDFGGAPKMTSIINKDEGREEVEESDQQTAAREWREETSGIYGCLPTYCGVLSSSPKIEISSDVVIYLVCVPFSKDLPSFHNNQYRFYKRCMKPVPNRLIDIPQYIPSCPEGFNEKSSLEWYTIHEILSEVQTHSQIQNSKFRSSFIKSFSSNQIQENLYKCRIRSIFSSCFRFC